MSTLRGEVNKLLSGIKAGKEDSKEKLFELTYNHLKIIARCYVHNKNDIEDVLQIAYLKVFRYINAIDVSKDGYNWLCKIVQNEAYRFGKNNPTYLPLYLNNTLSKGLFYRLRAYFAPTWGSLSFYFLTLPLFRGFIPI